MSTDTRVTDRPLSKTAQLKLERAQRREQRDAERLRILERSFVLRKQALELTRQVPPEFSAWGYFKTSAWITLATSVRRAIERPSFRLELLEQQIADLRGVPGWDVERCAKVVASTK